MKYAAPDHPIAYDFEDLNFKDPLDVIFVISFIFYVICFLALIIIEII